MDQIQIGKFIAACRKEMGLTQAQLAEKMSVSDRAVSKWETGKNMPDSSIMLDLCAELGITVNDLLNGRRIAMENYKDIAEKTMFEMRQAKEQNDKLLLMAEFIICVPAVLMMLVLCLIAGLAQIADWLRVLLIVIAFLQVLPALFISLWIEQRAGYYMCKKCGHRWVPEYKQVFFAPHFGRSRKMTCPSCGKRCYHKKVMTKEK